MRIHVTGEDIQAGRRWQGTLCPIAHALNRTIPHSHAWVDSDVTNGHRTPWVVFWRVAWYDFFGRMRPFSFDLPVES